MIARMAGPPASRRMKPRACILSPNSHARRLDHLARTFAPASAGSNAIKISSNALKANAIIRVGAVKLRVIS